ncbi:MAG TPA: cytosolic protein [Chloroflexi bacterium]|nr:cytosolic protein [Chloroflexota bacterium]
MTPKPLNLESVRDYIAEHIGTFHQRRLESLERLRLHQILRRKNPYLFRAKNILTAEALIRSILDAHLSSQEETLFGEFLEGLAIFVCQQTFGGHKSTAEGIDLEFQREGTYYLVSIKSGPNWGNSSQIQRMKRNFQQAIRRLRQNAGVGTVVAVNGCAYGRDNHPDKGDYLKLCGQRFWEFISGNERLYLDIIEPLGHQAKQRNAVFQQAYAQLINRLTRDFLQDFCHANGLIDWEKLVAFNAAANAR